MRTKLEKEAVSMFVMLMTIGTACLQQAARPVSASGDKRSEVTVKDFQYLLNV